MDVPTDCNKPLDDKIKNQEKGSNSSAQLSRSQLSIKGKEMKAF